MGKSIPKGYQIQIHSWENDADYYNTITKSGLTKETAKFYIEFAKIFGQDKEFGNATNDYGRDDVDWTELTTLFKALVEKYPNALKEIGWNSKDLDLDDQDSMRDSVTELHYDLFGGSEFYLFRVYDGHEAYLFTEPVKPVKL